MSERKPYANDSIGDVDAPPYTTTTTTMDEKAEIARHHAAVDADVHQLAEKRGDGADGLAPMDDIEQVITKIEVLGVEECRQILSDMLEYHKYDYNFGETTRAHFQRLIDGPADGQTPEEWETELKTETAVNKFFSPYPEVRAITTPTDDQDMPCETPRAVFLGLCWAVVSQFTNSLFNSRYPQITLSSSVAQILLYPCGLLFQYILPDWGFTWRGSRVSLNPGPWSYKEQMLATIMINVGSTSAYCFWNIQTQTVYYGDKWLTPAYSILLLLSTQMMGLGFSGLLRRFVIYPVEAIWPSILPTLALNRALLVPEKRETIHGWSISRYKFFFIVFAAMFVYFWIPGYLFPALSTFAWMTWIAPRHFTLNTITGSQAGLGFNPIPTFDWNYLAVYSQPLVYPFFATIQQYIGTIIGGLCIVGLYWTNVQWSAYLPINDSGIFDNTGARYNISRVVVPGTGTLNQTAYEAYSPAYYSAGNLVVYGAFFAFYPLTFVFIFLDAWRPLWRATKSMCASVAEVTARFFSGIASSAGSLVRGRFGDSARHLYNIGKTESSIYDGFDNPLTDLVRKYPEVPDWWFLMIALISFIFSIIILTQWPQLDTPVWTIFFVIALNLIFLIPMSYLYAISGTTEGLNVVTELIVGYALPGHPEALMFVKAFGYNINGQADNYISDQKMGFYAKLPPRAMYRGQVLSSVVCSFIAYAVVQFADTQIPHICDPHQESKFTCANGSQVYFSASVVWGAIGPARIFSQIYPALKYCFLLGFLLAVFWWVGKRFGSHVRNAAKNALPGAIYTPLNLVFFKPLSLLKNIHPSLIMNGLLFWAPNNLSYFTGGVYVSFAFMYYLRRYKTAWWEKYNYLLSAGLTGAVAFCGIILFFAVQYHPKDIHWWGTDIVGNTIDGRGLDDAQVALLSTNSTFGPSTWH
ncbi:Oligopeptide transporter 2 [Beauveria bassiana D1-5]|uniref:Oligopeptide transporter 2 n=1 Tax=Beauveria bassiana D1-5 TaxID=1245745 RepID=A0A0A2V7G8_BEABA|nr:Oligopeptide transporter 2 [Beauveria bassiana D1-5]